MNQMIRVTKSFGTFPKGVSLNAAVAMSETRKGGSFHLLRKCKHNLSYCVLDEYDIPRKPGVEYYFLEKISNGSNRLHMVKWVDKKGLAELYDMFQAASTQCTYWTNYYSICRDCIMLIQGGRVGVWTNWKEQSRISKRKLVGNFHKIVADQKGVTCL